MERKPTIKDVAREAGVSHATVSYVISNSDHADRISEDTKRRILEAVDNLGYKPNSTARALKRGYTNQIILLIVSWNLAKSHAASAMAISQTAAEMDFDVTVHVAEGDHDAEAFLKRRILSNIMGILVLWDSPAQHSSALASMAKDGLPVVDLLPDSPEGISVVTADREHALYNATKHLIELGHTQIGMISDTSSRAKTSLQKLAGYMRALDEAGIGPDESLIENITEFGFEGGYGGFERLRMRCPGITAVVAINDPIALGAIVAAGDAGLKCPDDISVVGYGDSPEGGFWRPQLTTAAMPVRSVAQKSIEMIKALRKNSEMKAETILVPGDMIIRGSTGPAK